MSQIDDRSGLPGDPPRRYARPTQAARDALDRAIKTAAGSDRWPVPSPGRVWRSGVGDPDPGGGHNGDFYQDLAGKAWWGPKTAGSWIGFGPHSMIGPQGGDL